MKEDWFREGYKKATKDWERRVEPLLEVLRNLTGDFCRNYHSPDALRDHHPCCIARSALEAYNRKLGGTTNANAYTNRTDQVR